MEKALTSMMEPYSIHRKIRSFENSPFVTNDPVAFAIWRPAEVAP